MNKARYRWALRIAIPLVVAAGVIVWALGGKSLTLTIENRSGQPIAFLTVTIAGQEHTFRDVPSGADRTTLFRVKGDDPFEVQGELANKTGIIHMVGHLSEAVVGENPTLTVMPNGHVQFRRADKGPGR